MSCCEPNLLYCQRSLGTLDYGAARLSTGNLVFLVVGQAHAAELAQFQQHADDLVRAQNDLINQMATRGEAGGNAIIQGLIAGMQGATGMLVEAMRSTWFFDWAFNLRRDPEIRARCVRRQYGHFMDRSAMAHQFAVPLHNPEAAGHHAHGFASRMENLPVSR